MTLEQAEARIVELLREFQTLPTENPDYQALVDLIPNHDDDSDSDFCDGETIDQEPVVMMEPRRNELRSCRVIRRPARIRFTYHRPAREAQEYDE